ncbi:MAG: hypothetical protein AAGG50_00335 [Bacteroidota bacterium]
MRQDTLVAIQLTGTGMHEGYDFSSIRLGDPASEVLRVLGTPTVTRDAAAVSDEFWGYAPFPISFELIDDKVYSMRISLYADL